MTKNDTYIDPTKLTEVAKEMFIKGGLLEEDAYTIAVDLVAANLRGLDFHGVSRIRCI